MINMMPLDSLNLSPGSTTTEQESVHMTNQSQGAATRSIDQMFEQIQQNQMVLLTNLGSFQRSTDQRLGSLEEKAGSSLDCITTLSGKVDAAGVEIGQVTEQSKTNTKNIITLENTLQAALTRIENLEKDVLDLDRHNREYCLRILNAPEENAENCKLKVANIIKNNDLLPNSANLNPSSIAHHIEDAHRLGKVYDGRTRHLLVRFHEIPFRDTVIRSVKRLPGGKTREGCVFLDDLPAKDREMKIRNNDITESHYAYDRTPVLFKRGQFKMRGQWYTEEEYRRTRPRTAS